MLYQSLAVFAAVVGLIVIGTAVYMAWTLFKTRKPSMSETSAEETESTRMSQMLLKWTVFDYATVALVCIAFVFFAADLAGVLKDREAYPFYHYGYLLSGFIFSLIGFVMLLARLFLVLRMAGSPRPLPPEHLHTPDKTDSTEHGV